MDNLGRGLKVAVAGACADRQLVEVAELPLPPRAGFDAAVEEGLLPDSIRLGTVFQLQECGHEFITDPLPFIELIPNVLLEFGSLHRQHHLIGVGLYGGQRYRCNGRQC